MRFKGLPGKEQVGLAVLDDRLVGHHGNPDRGWSGRLCTHAGALYLDRQAVAAHVALADDAPLDVELGHVVGAGEGAVLAADALIVEVLDESRVSGSFWHKRSPDRP